jgi:hypothetical protein
LKTKISHVPEESSRIRLRIIIMLSRIYAGRELGERLPVRKKVNGAFMS